MRSATDTLALLVLVAAICTAAVGCGPKSLAAPVPPLPQVGITDVAAPASSSVVVQSGSNLRTIAAEAYGHEDFSGFVGSLNGIASPERLMAGATLQTPSLPIAFRDAGLDPRYQPAINALAKAWNDLHSVLPAYTADRDASRARDGQTFPIVQNLRAKMADCADAIDAAVDVLNHPAPGHHAPRSAIGQFTTVSRSLRRLSTGAIGTHDYDTYMLQKGCGLGLTYALIWTQEHHQ